MANKMFSLPPAYAAELGAQPLKEVLHSSGRGLVTDIALGASTPRTTAFAVGAILIWFQVNNIESFDEMFAALERAVQDA